MRAMGDDKSSGALPAVQLRIELQYAAGEFLNSAGGELWDYLTPLAHGALRQSEGPGSDGLPQIDRIEVRQNGLFQHTKDYSMLTSAVEYANERVAYSSEMQTMGDRIRQLRQARALSQGQLADRVGVTAGAISQWENGLTKNIRLETFLRLCEELGTIPHYLIFGPGKAASNQGRSRQA